MPTFKTHTPNFEYDPVSVNGNVNPKVLELVALSVNDSLSSFRRHVEFGLHASSDSNPVNGEPFPVSLAEATFIHT